MRSHGPDFTGRFTGSPEHGRHPHDDLLCDTSSTWPTAYQSASVPEFLPIVSKLANRAIMSSESGFLCRRLIRVVQFGSALVCFYLVASVSGILYVHVQYAVLVR